jgi:hypothetical protein
MVLRLPVHFYEVSNMKSKSITVNIDMATALDGNPVELEYIRKAVKEKVERDARPKILYLCDHRACDKSVCDECNLTSDVRHAKNFENVNGTFVEKEASVPVFKRDGSRGDGFYVEGDSGKEFIVPMGTGK